MTTTATDTPLADLTGGAFLRAAREARGWTQSELARRAGIPGSALSNCENGKRSISNMSLDRAVRLLDALGLDTGDLAALAAMGPDGLRAARETRGWTQTELARRADIMEPTLLRYEAGKRSISNIRLSIAISLLKAFGMRLGDALRLLDEETTIPPQDIGPVPTARDARPAPASIPEDAQGGTFLRAARQARGWTQTELSRRTGIPGSALSNYETAKSSIGNMRLVNAVSLLVAFHLDTGDLSRLLDSGIGAPRRAHGWSLAELACRVGVQKDHLERYEDGRYSIGNMSLSIAVRLLKAFGMRLGDAGRLLDRDPVSMAADAIPEGARGGAFLRAARRSRGWSRAELARRVGLDEWTVARHEDGRHSPGNMPSDVAALLLHVLGLDTGDLDTLLHTGTRTLCADRGWTTAELARRAGLDDWTISRCEDRQGMLRLASAVRILHAMGLRTGDAERLCDRDQVEPMPDVPTPDGIPADARGGAFLRAARQVRGWNQAELARRAGVTAASLNAYEDSAEPRTMSLGTAIRLLDALGLDAGDLAELRDMDTRRLRRTRGWSQTELAHHLGIDSTILSNYETGRRCPAGMRLPTALRIMRTLGLRPGDATRLLEGD